MLILQSKMLPLWKLILTSTMFQPLNWICLYSSVANKAVCHLISMEKSIVCNPMSFFIAILVTISIDRKLMPCFRVMCFLFHAKPYKTAFR